MMRHGAVAWMTCAGLLAAAAATAGDAVPAEGRQVFDKWCAPCHAPGTEHPGTRALDAKYAGRLPAALEARKDLSADMVKLFVRRGISIMPFFRKTEISDAELDALAAYLSAPHTGSRGD